MIQDAMHQTSPRFTAFGANKIDQIPQLASFDRGLLDEIRLVARVLPFRVNSYVIDELIDWDAAPNDPIFRLVFPCREMLTPRQFESLQAAVHGGASDDVIDAVVARIRQELNPHPAGQRQWNHPVMDADLLEGIQHKYAETVLFFPSQGQTCHAYCSFCFRWAQFVGDKSLKMAEKGNERLLNYLRNHHEVSDLLLTGGDPAIMRSSVISKLLEPLLEPEFDHIQNIRIGTKALSFWPRRFVSDADADELLRLVETFAERGKHIALMAHIEHWRELETDLARKAVERLQSAGAIIRSQAPLLRNINDDAETWARNWSEQVKLGIIPYYMFVERNTGASEYFEVPLARAQRVYSDAIRNSTGLARTARGPSMSCDPGKIEVVGTSEVNGEKVFVLRFLQAREASWVGRPFFAKFDEKASWIDQLKPAFGEKEFFYQAELNRSREQEPAFTV